MAELKGFEYLRKKLDHHRRRGLLRYAQYDMKHVDIDVGITIPIALRHQYRATLGWCSKAVDVLADRLVFREFENDNFQINEIFRLNNPDTLFDSAVLSALITSCCFVYIIPDEVPRLQVIEGTNATGVIDPITGLLLEGYAVLKRDDFGHPVEEAYFEPGRTTYFKKEKQWTITHNSPYPLLVPIVHRPDAMRPFGRSRIT